MQSRDYVSESVYREVFSYRKKTSVASTIAQVLVNGAVQKIAKVGVASTIAQVLVYEDKRTVIWRGLME